MRILKHFAFTLGLALAFFVSAAAQERAVYLTVNIPAKRNIVSQDIAIGGEVYLPLAGGRVVVKTDLNFKDAVAFLLSSETAGTTADQLALAGTARFYLVSAEKKSRPFVEGGVATSFFLDAPVEGVTVNQAKSAFGWNFNNRVIPRFEFDTQDFTGTQFFGREYKAEVAIFIPVEKIRFKIEPYVSRKSAPITFTEYGISIGFGRTF